VVREKFHAATPMGIDQALFEMELVGHDFFLFTDATSGLPSVVYRRRGYQYGVIRLLEDHAASPDDRSESDQARVAAERSANGQVSPASPADWPRGQAAAGPEYGPE
jgi:hypothetical protein